MHWLIKCRSKPGTDAPRMATIDAHRHFLDGYPEVTWYSGPLFTDDNKNAIGSLRLIEFPDQGAAARRAPRVLEGPKGHHRRSRHHLEEKP
jgi:uncharacterized protein YciI